MRLHRVVAVLACALAACSPPRTQSQPSQLPPIPVSVPSALGPISVTWDDSLADSQGRSIMAGFHPLQRRIYLSKSITNRVVAWHALEHERCHVAMWDTGLRAAVPDAVAQQLCDTFATARVADMLIALRR